MQAQGIPVQALAERPALAGPLQRYLVAFYDLSRGRQITMGGAGPIPLSEIHAYMQIFEMQDLDERRRFMDLMTRMDGVYLEHQRKKQDLARSQEN